jgi:hypothetical protein
MRTITVIAVLLIAIGVIAFGYHGLTYTTSENVVDLGPVKMTKETTKTIPFPPIVGGVALVGGIVLLVLGRKKS